MSVFKIAVVGVTGRMGQEIVQLAQQDSQMEVTVGIARTEDQSAHIYASFADIPHKNDVDALIDFSSPGLFEQAITYAQKNQLPFVSGTTGLAETQFKKLEEAAKIIPVLWAPNMSLGIALVNEMLKTMVRLPEADFQLFEAHHRHKKDRPSGTSRLLHETLERHLQKPIPEDQVMRAGGIFGLHQIYAVTDEEEILIEHRALNRKVFAKGAVTAARWLVNKPPGRYHISQVLEFS